MSGGWYVIVMLGIIVVVAAISAPALFTKRCPSCQTRNGLDAKSCRRCGAAFPNDE